MDLAALSVCKSLFLANRGKNTINQMSSGQSCTAAANAARCAISASQAIVPVYAVSKCLAATASNPTIKSAAMSLSNSNLQKIALTMTSGTTQSALNNIASMTGFLAKLGLIGNISYAVAKCLDAKEEDKAKTFMKASGNLAGMYLFENLYSKVVSKVQPDTITKGAETLVKNASKFTWLKNIKGSSILIGIGFVAASLFGCWLGEKFGEKLYATCATPTANNVDLMA